MSHVHQTTLELAYETDRRARIVAESIRREVGEIGNDRSRTTVERSGRTVTVEITAADLVALRAGANTWLSLVSVAERSAAVGADHA